VNHNRLSKFLLVFIISSLIISCFLQFEPASVRAQDELIAQPMHIVQNASPMNSPSGYSPTQIKNAYGLPFSGGAGTTIAIIDAYFTQTIWNDLSLFSNQFNLPIPTNNTFEVYNMSTTIGVANNKWATETCLDVEWAHAIAPEAKILLVEAKSADSNDLISGIDYALSLPGVVAISMSWGIHEFSEETSYDSILTSNYGTVLFASSGDNGAGVDWPACSPNVVAVGGTTLNLNSTDGTVTSEVAWSRSGGGVSAYEPIPSYQSSYGLTTTNRAVPDVSYDANPSTGVSVCYNSQWIVVGGTSVGAPQWAAIQALGLSATSANLYGKAKSAYSSYFRDITSGSNGLYNATAGYDYVTGLGSPLTDNFNSTFTVSPTSGPGGGSITLNGLGFTMDSSVNISYLNPITANWVSIVNNSPTGFSQNFNYTLNAPDLLQNDPTGDNPQLSDNIVFQAQDNSNGNSYNTTVPYTEWRRGLTQIANASATGVYGNNTDLGTTVFVQNNQSIAVVGTSFSPGNVSLLWDSIVNLGTATTDPTGFVNTTVLVPNTSAGEHTLTINDGISNFSVTLTRLPTVANDYDGLWHNTDFSINLTPDFNVSEIYYTINNGTIFNVTANGQPAITSEGSNNTLEYWATWNVYGTGTMEELPHTYLTGIALQKTPPQGSIQINNGATSTASSGVTLTINASDLISGISQVRFSNDGTWDQSTWEQFTNTTNWQLTGGDGLKTVYCQIQDNAGLITTVSSSIILSTPQPLSSTYPTPLNTSPTPAPATPSITSSPSVTPSPSATSTPSSSTSVISPSPESSTAPQVVELSIQVTLVLLALSTILFAVCYKRKVHVN
jgi:hypothetical protein